MSRRIIGASLAGAAFVCAVASAALADGGATGGSPRATPPPAAPSGFTAHLLTYGRHSLAGDDPNESLNEKANVDYGFRHGQAFDLRAELYKDPSFNENPNFVLGHNVNEPKLEYQLTYTVPVTTRVSLAAAILHHHNFLFPDAYYWGIATVNYTMPLTGALQLTTALSAEKRLMPGRIFYDGVATFDQRLGTAITFETTVHRYENWGQFDPAPTQKIEVETGFIKQIGNRRTLGFSFLRHYQNGTPNDQFSVLQLKYGLAVGPSP